MRMAYVISEMSAFATNITFRHLRTSFCQSHNICIIAETYFNCKHKMYHSDEKITK